MKKGFTIIELVVVMVVIGILTTLVSIQVSRSQLIGRDKERDNDVKIITSFLENTYRSGQSNGAMVPTGDVLLTTATPMGYPSTALISSPADTQSKAILGAIDQNGLKSPIKTTMSLVAASNATGVSGSTAGGITITATSANDVYVYQPLTSANALCANANSLNANQLVVAPRSLDACIKFNMYYLSETLGSIKTISSINSNNNGL